MGNDHSTTFDAVAHLQIIDASCRPQMLPLMKGVMPGNRGLLYVRVMRTPPAVLYNADYTFEYRKRAFVHGGPSDDAFIVSAGRGVHEALAAARECAASGVRAAVIDMPSIDPNLLIELCDSGKVVCLAEQNNGYILQNLLKVNYRRGGHASNVIAINTLDGEGKPQFIHSGTYEELIEAFRLTPQHIAKTVMGAISTRGSK